MAVITINGYEVSQYLLGTVGDHYKNILQVTPPEETMIDGVSYYCAVFKLRNKARPYITRKYYTCPFEIPLVSQLTQDTKMSIQIWSYDTEGNVLRVGKKIEGLYFNPSPFDQLNTELHSDIIDFDDIVREITEEVIDEEMPGIIEGIMEDVDEEVDEKFDEKFDEITEIIDEKVDEAVEEALVDIDAELDKKVDKVPGKGLSTNDFTDGYKSKLDSAYQNMHTHSNKAVLDELSDSDSKLFYNGTAVGIDPLTNSEMLEICEIIVD